MIILNMFATLLHDYTNMNPGCRSAITIHLHGYDNKGNTTKQAYEPDGSNVQKYSLGSTEHYLWPEYEAPWLHLYER